MRDPSEGLLPDGTINTGVARTKIPNPYLPLLDDLTSAVPPDVWVYVYGSVATGMARLGLSDMDIVAVGLDPSHGKRLSRDLSLRYADVAREVAVGAWSDADLGDDDAGNGNRVFLKHYCAWLAGPDVAASLPSYPGDKAAARGFNGDVAHHLARWRQAPAALDTGDTNRVNTLARRIGRKTLFAVAGLVSIHDHTWTTDRETAARRWAQVRPDLDAHLDSLLAWGDGVGLAHHKDVGLILETTVAAIVDDFETEIGLW